VSGTAPSSQTDIKDVPAQLPVDSSAELLRSRLVSVRADMVRFPGDQIAERDVVIHPGSVGVLALDDADRVLMIRQYRHPVGRLLWEIPAGLRDVQGEPPWRTAQRELAEEAGYRARDWHTLVDYYSSPGYSTERLRIFLARDLEAIPEAERDFVPEHEEADLITGWVPLADAVRLVLAGELHDGPLEVAVLAGHVAQLDGFTGLRPADAPET
jgi:8-oxo-dGTP pyrophosphatase MutT (NUDIX family)